jgi:hypothetical protein
MEIEDIGLSIRERVDDIVGHGRDSDDEAIEDSVFQDYLIGLDLFGDIPSEDRTVDPLTFIPDTTADYVALKSAICGIAGRIDCGLRLSFVKAVVEALTQNCHRSWLPPIADRVLVKRVR